MLSQKQTSTWAWSYKDIFQGKITLYYFKESGCLFQTNQIGSIVHRFGPWSW